MEYKRLDAVGLGLRDEYLTAIGAVCVAWAQADVTVNSFLSELIPIADLKGQHIIGGTIEMRNKIDLAKYYARLRITDHQHFEVIEAFLNRLADYSAERNRVAHDIWIAGQDYEKEGFERARMQFRPSLKKAQAGEPTQLYTVSHVPMSLDDVLKIRDAIVSLTVGIMALHISYLAEKGGAQIPWPDISNRLPPKPNPPRVDS